MTDNEIIVAIATPDEYDMVGSKVFELLTELFPDETSYQRDKCIVVARNLLSKNSPVWAFVAKNSNDELVGVLTLNECAAIYSYGNFGEISELYVESAERSSGVGAKLIEAATEFGRNKGWPELEVGAPPVPEWQKSVDFYIRQGFVKGGPRLSLSL
jgi:GNAT superfamily N-acetyltransferase